MLLNINEKDVRYDDAIAVILPYLLILKWQDREIHYLYSG